MDSEESREELLVEQIEAMRKLLEHLPDDEGVILMPNEIDFSNLNGFIPVPPLIDHC